MVSPNFSPTVNLKAFDNGYVESVDLEDAPVSSSMTVALTMTKPAPDAKNEFFVDLLAAFERGTQMYFPDSSNFPPGKVPEPFEETVFKETRRVVGAGPMQVNAGEDVSIGLGVRNLTDDFVEAHGILTITADGWDPIAIKARFFRTGLVAVEIEAIDLEVRQGELVSGSVPVRWVAGPASSVFCSTFKREVGSLDALPLDLTSPKTPVPMGGTVDVPFVIQCGFDCPTGPKRLSAWVTGFDGSDDFDVNLNVLPKPPPPPSTDIILPGGYSLVREGDLLRLRGKRITPQLTVENETIATVTIGREGMTNEQKDQLVETTKKNVREYFKENGVNFTAAQAGAALYGAASAAAVLMTFGPTAAIPFVGPAAVKLGSNVGEFYGSIVDDLAALIKGESETNVAEFVGTMGTLFFTQINPIVAGVDLIRFMGADGWHLTREIGKAIGSGLEAAVEGVGSVVGDVVDAIGGAIGDAVDFIGGIFS